ncbi:uncharacterized protein A1O9_11731, partial [Exophiala aquamarina CBS 119918]
KDGWYWLGVAISLAKAKGLYQDINNERINPTCHAIRRRSWWSCCIRDALASFSTNRAARIRSQFHTVASVTMEGFHIEGNP